MLRNCLIAIIVSASLVPPCFATEPDFYIDFQSCRTTVGYLVLAENNIKAIEGTPTTMGCIRQGENVSCSFVFKDGQRGHKGNSESYKVVIDSPPILHFVAKNGSEHIVIDTSQHAAVLVSLVFDLKYAGSKICHGLYATGFEMKKLTK